MSCLTEVGELIRDARSAEGRGDLGLAITKLEEAYALDPNHLQTLVLLARFLQYQGEWERSIALAEAILAIDDQSARAHSLLGHAYQGLGDSVLECDAFLRASQLNPSPALYVLAGDAAMGRGDAELAERCFRDALTLDPRYHEALLNLALLLRISEPKEAERWLREMVTHHPKDERGLRELGFVLGYTKRLTEAESVLRKSIGIKDNAWARVYLGMVLLDGQQIEEAEEEYARAHRLDPNLGAFDFLANAFDRRGDRDKAAFYRARSMKK